MVKMNFDLKCESFSMSAMEWMMSSQPRTSVTLSLAARSNPAGVTRRTTSASVAVRRTTPGEGRLMR